MTITKKCIPTTAQWIRAKPINSQQTAGMIPSNYFKKTTSLSSYPWFFGNISRNDAERLLRSDENQTGSFLVRNSSTKTDSYCISVRQEQRVKHYIFHQGTSGKYYITPTKEFKTIPQFIRFHQRHAHEGFTLGQPCVQPSSPPDSTYGLSYDLADEWQLDRSLLVRGDEIGRGHFGIVEHGIWDNKTEVAVKQLIGTETRDFLREAEALKKLHHTNIVQLFGVCVEKKPLLLVTEYMVNGDLLQYLRRGAGRNFPFERLIDIAIQVASGMAFLESKNYVHRDLAARNVLVGRDDVYKVADFGMARLLEENFYPQKASEIATKWAAPEMLKEEDVNHKSDVWSFGICLYEIVEKGKTPYKNLSNAQAKAQVLQGTVMKIDEMENCPLKLYNLMRCCWQYEKKDRPTFAQLWEKLSNFDGSDSEMENFFDLDQGTNVGISEVIGEGSFGTVTKERLDSINNGVVAVRTVNKRNVDINSFRSFAERMEQLKHPNLVEIFGTWADDDANLWYIASDYMSGPTLLLRLQKGEYLLSESTALATQIASGMAYLESENFIHGNLAARNIFVARDNTCKISDFGIIELSKHFEYYSQPVDAANVKWKAPEVLHGHPSLSVKSDVWAFGICLFEIMEKGKEPYPELSNDEVVEKVRDGYRMQFEEMEYCSGKIFALMQKCWQYQPVERIAFKELEKALGSAY